MYDPIQNDNYNEWIEIYNPSNKSINISGWSICDNYAEDYFEADYENGNGTTIIPSLGYAIITDHGTKTYENFTIPKSTTCIYIDDKSIGNGLGNSGDKLMLKNNQNQIVDTIEWIKNYTDIPGTPANSVKEGYSLSRKNNIDTNNSSIDFYEGMIPTPGSKNIYLPGEHRIIIDKKTTFFYIRKNYVLNIPIPVKNQGFFVDNITIAIKNITDGWTAFLEKQKICLKPNETKNVDIKIIPCEMSNCLNGLVNISVKTEKDFGFSDEITIEFEKYGPDLTIRKLKIYNEQREEKSSFNHGEIIRVKAFLKNIGNEKANDVKVKFYYDKLTEENYIGCKYYNNISKYQKYPSIKIDTSIINPGYHSIIAVVDKKNVIDELNELNNCLSFNFEVFDTYPLDIYKKILISEVYYHSHSSLYNEYITIYNPTSEKIDIGGWYFTNNPLKRKTDQTKIIFPKNTTIQAKTHLVLSENAETYQWETGKKPDFEYNVDSDKNITQMISLKKFIMSNKGCKIALKDSYNHTIDLLVYGEAHCNNKNWYGSSIPCVGEGVILKRKNINSSFYFDTNNSNDWNNSIRYGIGQSDLPYKKIRCNGEIKPFVSPDNSFETIIKELRKANKTICLNIYEFTNSFLCDELVCALRRNVTVKIFLEGSPVGGICDEQKFILNRLETNGGEIRFIINDPEENVYSRYPFNHAKYLIIDNKTVIVESCNWVQTGISKNPSFGNREWGVIVRDINVSEYFLDVFFDDFNPQRCDSVSYNDLNLSFSADFFMNEKEYYGFYEPKFESNVINGSFSIIPVVSPDISINCICDLINSAEDCIYVEQLYIYKDWEDRINPFVDLLINKSKNGVVIKVILNYNPSYKNTVEKCNITKNFFEENGIEVRYVYTNSSVFTNVHNKGVIVDNKSVLISSINWNENSVMCNRETGVIIENSEVAEYYAKVFFSDWSYNYINYPSKENDTVLLKRKTNYENTIYIIIIFTLTFGLIARDWRKRKWH